MEEKQSKGDAFFVSFFLSDVNINLNIKEKLINFQSKTTYILNSIHIVWNSICFRQQFIFSIRCI